MSIVAGNFSINKGLTKSTNTQRSQRLSKHNITSNSISTPRKRSSVDSAKSERESLERIHTFSLKESKDTSLFLTNRARGISVASKDSSGSSVKSQYMPEKIQICNRQLTEARVTIDELFKI